MCDKIVEEVLRSAHAVFFFFFALSKVRKRTFE